MTFFYFYRKVITDFQRALDTGQGIVEDPSIRGIFTFLIIPHHHVDIRKLGTTVSQSRPILSGSHSTALWDQG